MAAERTAEHLDVLVIGAGLSGIDMGYRLQTECPGKSYAIVETRDAIGGTWDLFRYPGIRSDSDMATLGFPFRPWRGDRSIVGGEQIRDYVADTARVYGIDRKIRFNTKVVAADWSSAEGRWHVTTEGEGGRVMLTCGFVYMAAGYYDFDRGYRPEFAGEQTFAGTIVHPQHWPEDLDYSGKRVVVIGSGATAVTLVPAMLPKAAHVTMLQRSPTYMVSRPAEDEMAKKLRRWLPAGPADTMVRWKNVLLGMFFYRLARKKPEVVKQRMLDGVRAALGDGHDIARDYTPSYNPWDQRVCLVPDSDLFNVVRDGKAAIVTETIDRFVPEGIVLSSGKTLPADIVVTATGLNMRMLGGVDVTVDGTSVGAGGRLSYKGMMLDGIPNLAFAFGYTNASWTLKCDLTARYVCRLLNHMDRTGRKVCTPVAGPDTETEDMVDFTSGYIARAKPHLPIQGKQKPWKIHQNYLLDKLALQYARVDDGTMRFGNPTGVAAAAAEPVPERAAA